MQTSFQDDRFSGMKTKKCPSCRVSKPVGDFSRSKTSKDGRQSWCKECSNARAKKWREANPERAASKSRDWETNNRQRVIENRRAWRERNPDYMREYLKRWHEKNPGKLRKTLAQSEARYPERVKARHALNAAIARGDITKPDACECCGREATGRELQGHHPDYSKALDVRWLHIECHADLHKTLRDKEAQTP